MVNVGENIKDFYLKMEHVTCMVHKLNIVAEEVLRHFPKVNALITIVKKIFVKYSSRVLKVKEIAPGIPLPPQLILTRSGRYMVNSSFILL